MRDTATPRRLRYAVVVAKTPPDDLEARVADGEQPRLEHAELARRLGATVLDYRDVHRSTSALVRQLARRLGPRWGLALLAHLRRREFDAVYLAGEEVGIPLALLASAAAPGPELSVVVHNADTFRRRAIFRHVARAFERVICLGSAHQDLLVEELGVPAARLELLHAWVDHRFFAPSGAREPGDYALSVGLQRRDYRTLEDAARNLPYRFHVVATGASPHAARTSKGEVPAGPNFTLGCGYDPRGLRALYAGARLVVLPLRRARHAAGVRALLEAMAMGKAVVTTDSPGLRDYVRDGRVGKVVPVGDVQALRDAIAELWHDPVRLAEIGRQNRAWVESVANVDHYVAQVAALLGAPPRVKLATA